MNIHEDCLINYLEKPDELSHTTDVLKVNNAILAKNYNRKILLAKKNQAYYTSVKDSIIR